VFCFRYYELDTAYCEEGDANSTADYEASDMKNYVQIRKWGQTMEKLKEGMYFKQTIIFD
jgi:hypothetical protein